MPHTQAPTKLNEAMQEQAIESQKYAVLLECRNPLNTELKLLFQKLLIQNQLLLRIIIFDN